MLPESDLESLAARYPGLSLMTEGGESAIAGCLEFGAAYEGTEIADSYDIKIYLPREYPESPPKVFENAGKIPKEYHHNQDGSLCLATPTEILLFQSENPGIVRFIDGLLVPFLYRYSYWQRFGSTPWGERRHGTLGLLDSYSELLGTDELETVMSLLHLKVPGVYRGHSPCPCKSGLRLRDCHGARVLGLPGTQTLDDYFEIFQYLKKGGRTGGNIS